MAQKSKANHKSKISSSREHGKGDAEATRTVPGPLAASLACSRKAARSSLCGHREHCAQGRTGQRRGPGTGTGHKATALHPHGAVVLSQCVRAECHISEDIFQQQTCPWGRMC